MLLVIGLDGGTLDLAGPWMDEGKLPHLDRLRARGVWGELRSEMPPATMPNWTTFMTGVNPGRHGVFDFTQRVDGAYAVRFVNSSFRKAPSVWRLLSDAGSRVAVLGMPGTYPPEPINGCMVSGFDAPVTTRANRTFIYPPEIADEVMRMGGFSFADFQEFHVGPGWYRTALERLLRGIEAKGRLAHALLRRERWDCFALVFGESDTVAHHFWHFGDASSPRHVRGESAYADAVERVYRAIDGVLGSLIAAAPEPCAVLVGSDHGFGGAGARAVHLNRWLEREGWLRFAPGAGEGLAALAKRGSLRAIPARWQGALFRSFSGRIANRLESRTRFGGIDWSRTRAFSEELNYFPSIWINRVGREPLGQVAEDDYDRTCAEIIEGLRRWRDPQSGRAVVRRVWRRSELYAGPWVDAAPDIIVDLAEHGGYSYCCLGSQGRPGDAVRRLEPSELVGGKRFGMSGSHRPNGLFFAAAGAPKGRSRARMVDMAPTILTLCGVEPPAWMEGRSVIEGEEAALSRPAGGAAPGEERDYTAGEERILEERLRALGYIG